MVEKFSCKNTRLDAVKLIQPFYATDERGAFLKDYSAEELSNAGISHLLQEVFYTISHKGVIRAIHFQREKQQAKLVRVVKGAIFDVVVDLRKNSPTLGQWEGFYLNDDNRTEIYIPEHFGHGYLVLEDSIVTYKCSEKFYGEYDDGIMWNDPDIAIEWPLSRIGDVLLSDKDQHLQTFAEYRTRYL